jgi:hypothetical protein
MTVINSPLPDKEREIAGSALQAPLVDLLDLSRPRPTHADGARPDTCARALAMKAAALRSAAKSLSFGGMPAGRLL